MRFPMTLLCLAMLAGCSSQPAAVKPVDVDSQTASAEAMKLYDADGDGLLVDKELVAVPGILMAKTFYDKDTDGKVSQQEIEDRLDEWRKQALGFRSLTMIVKVDGQPLTDAEVTLEPEPYLGDAVKPAKGLMRPDGSVAVSVSEEDLPAAIKARGVRLFGVTGGTYKIRIRGEKKPLPSKFNEATEIGVEVAHDTIKSSYSLNLKSK